MQTGYLVFNFFSWLVSLQEQPMLQTYRCSKQLVHESVGQT
jgi:hypothetical protein